MKTEYHEEMEDVEMFEKKTVSVRVDEMGREIKTFKWEKMTKPVSLGSMKKPKNEEFLGFEVRDKRKPLDMGGMMEGLFGGRK
jgi:hypothetical protein